MGRAVSADVEVNADVDGFAEDVVAVVDNELVSAFLLSVCSVGVSAGDKRGADVPANCELSGASGEACKEECTNGVFVAA